MFSEFDKSRCVGSRFGFMCARLFGNRVDIGYWWRGVLWVCKNF
jgi:hypothetical protein